jgi:hypothetical protein
MNHGWVSKTLFSDTIVAPNIQLAAAAGFMMIRISFHSMTLKVSLIGDPAGAFV